MFIFRCCVLQAGWKYLSIFNSLYKVSSTKLHFTALLKSDWTTPKLKQTCFGLGGLWHIALFSFCQRSHHKISHHLHTDLTWPERLWSNLMWHFESTAIFNERRLADFLLQVFVRQKTFVFYLMKMMVRTQWGPWWTLWIKGVQEMFRISEDTVGLCYFRKLFNSGTFWDIWEFVFLSHPNQCYHIHPSQIYLVQICANPACKERWERIKDRVKAMDFLWRHYLITEYVRRKNRLRHLKGRRRPKGWSILIRSRSNILSSQSGAIDWSVWSVVWYKSRWTFSIWAKAWRIAEADLL